jgi:hypothetical protein
MICVTNVVIKELLSVGHEDFSKKCRLCKSVKLLNQFEIDDKAKDKHAAICKDCVTRQSLRSTEQPSVCSCICERCTDDKIVKTAFSAVELLLTRVEKGLQLSEEMLMMISSNQSDYQTTGCRNSQRPKNMRTVNLGRK